MTTEEGARIMMPVFADAREAASTWSVERFPATNVLLKSSCFPELLNNLRVGGNAHRFKEVHVALGDASRAAKYTSKLICTDPSDVGLVKRFQIYHLINAKRVTDSIVALLSYEGDNMIYEDMVHWVYRKGSFFEFDADHKSMLDASYDEFGNPIDMPESPLPSRDSPVFAICVLMQRLKRLSLKTFVMELIGKFRDVGCVTVSFSADAIPLGMSKMIAATRHSLPAWIEQRTARQRWLDQVFLACINTYRHTYADHVSLDAENARKADHMRDLFLGASEDDLLGFQLAWQTNMMAFDDLCVSSLVKVLAEHGQSFCLNSPRFRVAVPCEHFTGFTIQLGCRCDKFAEFPRHIANDFEIGDYAGGRHCYVEAFVKLIAQFKRSLKRRSVK